MTSIPELNAREYASPLVGDCNLMPLTKRVESLSDSIDNRITFVTNTKIPNDEIKGYVGEFLRFLVPDVGNGFPYSLEETRDKLDKPAQRLAVNQIWDTVDSDVRRQIEGFIKNEPTNKSSRMISSFADMRYILKFSAYTHRFRDEILHHERNKHWFMPGRTPKEIADKVVEYVGSVREPIEGDFSNFDGTVSPWCQRSVMNAAYHRYFDRNLVQKELKGYTDMLVTCPAKSKAFGFRYDSGPGVKSGSPTTCDLNTILNAFIQYSALRLKNKFLNPEEAYNSIGPCFGDDMLFDRQYEKQLVKVVQSIGMTIKIERYIPERGLCFLARVFIDPFVQLRVFKILFVLGVSYT